MCVFEVGEFIVVLIEEKECDMYQMTIGKTQACV